MSGPTTKIIKRLFAVSGNRCAFPDCPHTLVIDGVVTGEICHIKARSAKWPRYDPKQTDKERHGFDNLLLLCPAHHKVVDEKPETYTVDWLLQIKAQHETLYTGGAEPSDDVARQFLIYTPPPCPAPDVLPDPGPLPPGFRIPFHRNALFTGRDGPLKALARALLHDEAPSTLITQAVQGMGGIGKTQLAVEFAWRYGRFFHGVHWLNANPPGGLDAEVAACGAAMSLPRWPEEQPEQVARTLAEWQQGGPRLVILDNLEDVEAARGWLPRLSGGPVRVLLTARRSDWPRDLGLNPLRLDVFTPEESREFLRRYLPEERATDADVDALADRLGHLPLALELAGRYLAGHPRLSTGDYLEKLAAIWEHPSMAGFVSQPDPPGSLAPLRCNHCGWCCLFKCLQWRWHTMIILG